MQNPFVSGKGLAKVHEDQANVVDSKTDVVGYAWGGEPCDPAADVCVAKRAVDPVTHRVRHWLKRATVGPEAGRLYNPFSPMFNAASVNRVHDNLGRGQYEFKPATDAAFDMYLKFLQTKDPRYVRQAERQV